MTRKEEKQSAINDEITPNFQLIATYYSDLNAERFYMFYRNYKESGCLMEAEKVIKRHKLELYRSDLIYFLVECAQTLEHSNWAKVVSIAKENQKGLKQKMQMLDFFTKIQTQKNHYQLEYSDLRKLPVIKGINLITDKGLSMNINSYQLCYDIITLLEKQYERDRKGIAVALSEKVNVSPRQYKKNFILGLKPFVKYLKNETKHFSSLNEIYSFIVEFLEDLPSDIKLDEEIIKDTLKPSKSRGKSTP
jgi:hypothetical protein